MTFSIVIPTYNGADFVREAIESALSQVRPADEIIVCDDNSTDGTREICMQYAPNVSLYHNIEGPSGFVNGWNWAINHASSEFIAILHQDDVLKNTFLQEAEKALTSYPAVKHFFCPCEYVDENGTLLQEAAVSTGDTIYYTALQYVKAYQQIGHPHIHRCPGVITHSDIFNQCAYRTEAGHIADDDFFYRVGQYTDVVGVMKPLAQYRLHGKSETGHLSDIKLVRRLIKDYSFQVKELDNNKVFDEECKEYIRSWLVKVVEMELVYIILHKEKDGIKLYKEHIDTIRSYSLKLLPKMKIYDYMLKVLGISLSNFILVYLYKIFKKS